MLPRPLRHLSLSAVAVCSAFAAATPHPFGRPLIPDMVADASIRSDEGVKPYFLIIVPTTPARPSADLIGTPCNSG